MVAAGIDVVTVIVSDDMCSCETKSWPGLWFSGSFIL